MGFGRQLGRLLLSAAHVSPAATRGLTARWPHPVPHTVGFCGCKMRQPLRHLAGVQDTSQAAAPAVRGGQFTQPLKVPLNWPIPQACFPWPPLPLPSPHLPSRMEYPV